MLDISLVQERRLDLPTHALAESIVCDLATQTAPTGGRNGSTMGLNGRSVASEQGRTGNMMVQKSQPLTRPPVDSRSPDSETSPIMERTNLNHNNTSHYTRTKRRRCKSQTALNRNCEGCPLFCVWYHRRILLDLYMRSWMIPQRLNELTNPQYST